MLDLRPYAYLIPLLPLSGFLLELFFGKYTWRRGGIIANILIFISMLISFGIFYNLYFEGLPYTEYSWQWFYPGIVLGVVVDPLSIAMCCMVSFVSLLIHIYALGYMDEDPSKALYFAETVLFTGGMLGLVLSNNLIQLFIFWELVGLCSYLLIGFWYYKPEAAAAGKKAWLFCSVGDFLFLFGIAVVYKYMFAHGEPLTFSNIFIHLEEGVIPPEVLTLVAILMLAGVSGKSSQFPLHGWIPDAMEGPTTVSALIHAATMVTAGVYLVARTFPLYLAAPHGMMIVAILGAFTALFAATLGLVVNDLKRILAYSTISQLGYMLSVLGVGGVVGAYAVGFSLYHLISHAFFKALLFLCAGAVLHGLWNTRCIYEMGGLWNKMRVTAITMLVGSLALIGFPLTAGYFSKDMIVEAAYEFAVSGDSTLAYLPWIFLTIGVLLTATYTFRAYFTVFTGKPKTYLAEHAHEASKIMTTPLVILAACALLFGAVQKPFYHFVSTTFDYLNLAHLAEMGGNHVAHAHAHHGHEVPISIKFLPTVLSLTGLGIAGYFYYNHRIDVGKYITRDNPIYKLLWNKYYIDYLYKDIIVERIVVPLAMFVDSFDMYGIDGVVNGIGRITMSIGKAARKIQTGDIQDYMVPFLIGIGIIAAIVKFLGVS